MIKIQFTLLIIFIYSLSAQDLQSIKRGKTLYDNICFSCHGKNLEGGVGFNLKDHEWIHGSSPSEISATIKKGFPDKGMLAFGALYNDSQIDDITTFLLSRQQGLRGLTYKIFHNVDMKSGIDWEKQKPSKTGKSKLPYPNFQLPEVDQFAMSYKGKLLIPAHFPNSFKLNGALKQTAGLEIYIDGQKIDFKLDKRKRFKQLINLDAGSHDFELRFIKDFRFTNLSLSLQGGGERIPLSIDSYRRFMSTEHIIKTGDSFKITRKSIKSYAPGSIAVTHADRATYVIDPNNAEISGLWEGKSLDIGPNINSRGQHPSLPLGTSKIKTGQALKIILNNKPVSISYHGYSSFPQPKFMFTSANTKIEISSAISDNSIILTYQVSPITHGKVTLEVPAGLNLQSKDGKLSKNIFTPNRDKISKFVIEIPLKENK